MNTDANILNKILTEFNSKIKDSDTMTKGELFLHCKDSSIYKINQCNMPQKNEEKTWSSQISKSK